MCGLALAASLVVTAFAPGAEGPAGTWRLSLPVGTGARIATPEMASSISRSISEMIAEMSFCSDFPRARTV